MNHIEEIKNTHNNPVVYATIGAFDGIHIGHQQLIRSMNNQAKIDHIETLVITFDPHPAVVLRSLPMPFYITSPIEKEHILMQLGVNHVLTLKFDRSLASLEPEEFLDLVLQDYQIQQLWLGKDFALGKNRSGNLTVLSEIGKHKGFKIIEKQHIQDKGNKVSSSVIRKWIQEGNFSETTKALDRYYSIQGQVTHGDSRGKGLGFPTANLNVWEGKLLPTPGVYATWITIEGAVFSSVTNVGYRPTFENKILMPRIEAHIFNFDRDIYNHQVQLHFVEQLRAEIKFNSIEALVNQISNDKRRAEEILKNATKPSNLFT